MALNNQQCFVRERDYLAGEPVGAVRHEDINGNVLKKLMREG
jgi:hypothetical protein